MQSEATSRERTSAGRIRRWETRAAAAALALASMVGILAVEAGTASAAYVTASGYPGTISMQQAVGAADGYFSGVGLAPRRVTESTAYARYDQYVCVTYRLHRLGSAGWALVSSVKRCAWIWGASTAVDVIGASFEAAPQFAYSVDMTVTWQLSNGTLVGSKYVDYAHRADYVCLIGNCLTGSSPQAGGYILFGL